MITRTGVPTRFELPASHIDEGVPT